MRRWRRVGVINGTQLVAGVLAAFGFSFVVLLVRGLFVAPARSIGAIIFALGFLVLWTAGTGRLNRVGVFISDFGVRSRSMFRTHTLEWKAIAGFEDRPATAGSAGWAANMMRARPIWIVPKDGPAIQTALAYRSSEPAEFLPPRGFLARLESRQARMLDEQPMIGIQRAQEKSGVVESELSCRAALHQLRAALRTARPDPPGTQ